MTVLDLILSNLSGTSTLASELYCTSTTMDDPDLRSTTICSVVTSYLDSIQVPTEIAIVHDTYSYVESMSEEELARANELIALKELDFEIPALEETNDNPKIYTKDK